LLAVKGFLSIDTIASTNILLYCKRGKRAFYRSRDILSKQQVSKPESKFHEPAQ